METRARKRPARIFVSYRRPDSALARRLQAADQSVPGLEFYSFPYEQSQSGTDWRETYRELISEADALVCVVGPATTESPHVAWELDEASRRGIPIILAGPGARRLALRRGDGTIEVVETVLPAAIHERLRFTE